MREVEGVGVMKDKELKLERHTHYLESYGHTETGVGLHQKPEDLSTYERVECGHGGRVGVCMLLCCSQKHYLRVMGECVI